MTTGVITPSKFTDGSYKRPHPKVIFAIILDLSPEEACAVRSGRRGCTCEAADLTSLGERCMAVARECNAPSWSITPILHTHIGVPKVYVEYRNWPESGMGTFKKPIGKARYWWDERPVPEYMDPVNGVKDDSKGGEFDSEA